MKLLLQGLLIILALSTSCNAINEELSYKFIGGYRIGDWIDFSSSGYNIKNDTIYHFLIPKAKLNSIKYRLDGSYIMKIESLENKEIGLYISK